MGAGAVGRAEHLADRQRQDRRSVNRGLSHFTRLDVQCEASGFCYMDDASHLLRWSISRDRDRAFTGRFVVLKKRKKERKKELYSGE